MKSIKLAAVLILLLTLLFSCKDKDLPDYRIEGRWKITEYYLNSQTSFDTITKYLDGFEYNFNVLQKSSGGPNIHGSVSYGHGFQWPQEEYIGSNLIRFSFYKDIVLPATPCYENVIGLFGCTELWNYSFISDTKMQFGDDLSSGQSHKLIFEKLN